MENPEVQNPLEVQSVQTQAAVSGEVCKSGCSGSEALEPRSQSLPSPTDPNSLNQDKERQTETINAPAVAALVRVSTGRGDAENNRTEHLDEAVIDRLSDEGSNDGAGCNDDSEVVGNDTLGTKGNAPRYSVLSRLGLSPTTDVDKTAPLKANFGAGGKANTPKSARSLRGDENGSLNPVNGDGGSHFHFPPRTDFNEHPLWGRLQPHAGWVKKKPLRKQQRPSTDSLSGVKDRFLVLDGLTLAYYLDHTRQQIKGVLGLNTTSTVTPTHSSTNNGGYSFVVTEFGNASPKFAHALFARTYSQFELDLWVRRIRDAIEFARLLGDAGRFNRKLQKSVVGQCILAGSLHKQPCRIQLHGNLLWLNPISKTQDEETDRTESNTVDLAMQSDAMLFPHLVRRQPRDSDASHHSTDSNVRSSSTSPARSPEASRKPAGSTASSATLFAETVGASKPILSMAIHCVSLSHASNISVDGVSTLRVGDGFTSADVFRIVFPTPAVRSRMMAHLDKLVKCLHAGMQGPLDGDLYVGIIYRSLDHVCAFVFRR